MSDRLELRGLRALGVHGALDFEQRQPQPFAVDLDIDTDFARAAMSDDLADALDYGAVVTRVVAVIETERFALLEALAQAIARTVLEDARVQAVTVRLHKLRPPVAQHLESAGVRITRRRAESR